MTHALLQIAREVTTALNESRGRGHLSLFSTNATAAEFASLARSLEGIEDRPPTSIYFGDDKQKFEKVPDTSIVREQLMDNNEFSIQVRNVMNAVWWLLVKLVYIRLNSYDIMQLSRTSSMCHLLGDNWHFSALLTGATSTKVIPPNTKYVSICQWNAGIIISWHPFDSKLNFKAK